MHSSSETGELTVGPSTTAPESRAAPASPVALLIGLGAIAVGALVILGLHIVGPGAEVSPILRTISEYGLTDAAWLFQAAVLLVSVGLATVLAIAVRTHGHPRHPHRGQPRVPRHTGAVLSVLAVTALVVLALVPKTDWAIGPSLHGTIHRIAGLTAFTALPLAVLMLLAGSAHVLPRAVRLTRVLAVAGLAWFTPIIAAVLLAGPLWWQAVPLGLVERGMVITQFAAVIGLAIVVMRANRGQAAG